MDEVKRGLIAERRSHPRFPEEVRVRYRDLEDSAPSGWGRSRDISLGGLRLQTDTEIPAGCHLAVEIHIETETAPVLALAEILRCEPSGDGWMAGGRFLWVSDEDRSNLRRLADYFKQRYGDPGKLPS